MIEMLKGRAQPLVTAITSMKVRGRRRIQGTRRAGPRRRRSKKVPRDLSSQKTIPVMTTTWTSGTFDILPGRQFDSDSQALMLDDGASACITNDKRDFIEPPTRVNHKVRGIKGHAKATYRGTIKWHVEDDTGLVHVMIIRGSYLITEAATRILSPHHLAQQAGDHFPKAEGTGAITTSKNITLFWSQRRFTKTVPLHPTTNVGMTTTASGARAFRDFCATLDQHETKQMNIFTTHIIPDDEDDESFQPNDPVEPPQATEDNTDELLKPKDDPAITTPQATVIDIGPITHAIPDNPEPKTFDPQDELLRWHYHLGHLHLTASSNWPMRGSYQNVYLTVPLPFAPLANTAR